MKKFLFLLLAYTVVMKTQAITVEDFAGRQVTLDKPAERIVALAPHIVENLYSAGAGSRLVGVVSYSNFPEAATLIPEVGTYNAFSLEQIVALQPDLVVMWGSGNGMQTLPALENLGIPVYVSELRHLSEIPQSIHRLSLLAGTDNIGIKEAARIEGELQKLRKVYGQEKAVSVFYQIWNEPLQTVNGDHLISELITLCGGRNIFTEAASLAPRISIESVLLHDPQAIVASGMGEARPEWLDQWRSYPHLTAVSQDALFFINPNHVQRPTSRILKGAQRLCEQLEDIR
ncbi:MAG: iron complex transport system substrate-binding protein [Halioglobus sp.]|jgi:iron complex transport system substrate-binding protein